MRAGDRAKTSGEASQTGPAVTDDPVGRARPEATRERIDVAPRRPVVRPGSVRVRRVMGCDVGTVPTGVAANPVVARRAAEAVDPMPARVAARSAAGMAAPGIRRRRQHERRTDGDPDPAHPRSPVHQVTDEIRHDQPRSANGVRFSGLARSPLAGQIAGHQAHRYDKTRESPMTGRFGHSRE